MLHFVLKLRKVGNDELLARFAKARDEETEHLQKVQAWYKHATLEQATQ